MSAQGLREAPHKIIDLQYGEISRSASQISVDDLQPAEPTTRFAFDSTSNGNRLPSSNGTTRQSRAGGAREQPSIYDSQRAEIENLQSQVKELCAVLAELSQKHERTLADLEREHVRATQSLLNEAAEREEQLRSALQRETSKLTSELNMARTEPDWRRGSITLDHPLIREKDAKIAELLSLLKEAHEQLDAYAEREEERQSERHRRHRSNTSSNHPPQSQREKVKEQKDDDRRQEQEQKQQQQQQQRQQRQAEQQRKPEPKRQPEQQQQQRQQRPSSSDHQQEQQQKSSSQPRSQQEQHHQQQQEQSQRTRPVEPSSSSQTKQKRNVSSPPHLPSSSSAAAANSSTIRPTLPPSSSKQPTQQKELSREQATWSGLDLLMPEPSVGLHPIESSTTSPPLQTLLKSYDERLASLTSELQELRAATATATAAAAAAATTISPHASTNAQPQRTTEQDGALRVALRLSEEKNALLDSKYRDLKRKYLRTSMKTSEIKKDMERLQHDVVTATSQWASPNRAAIPPQHNLRNDNDDDDDDVDAEHHGGAEDDLPPQRKQWLYL